MSFFNLNFCSRRPQLQARTAPAWRGSSAARTLTNRFHTYKQSIRFLLTHVRNRELRADVPRSIAWPGLARDRLQLDLVDLH
jgi:hypothetical protein